MAREKESAEEFAERLFFFWQIAQPLRHVVEELPALEKSIPIRMTLKVPLKDLDAPLSLEQLTQIAVEARWQWSMQNLSEAEFERLALRFRPFFAEKEATNFLQTIHAMAAQNPALRDWHKAWKKRWNRAVFWGAMSIPLNDLGMTADSIISVGFYSRYFHVTKERRAQAESYEAALGQEIYWLALTSAVWQRAVIVLDLAAEIEDYLVRCNYRTRAELDELGQRPVRPERITQSFVGGVGAVQIMPVDEGA